MILFSYVTHMFKSGVNISEGGTDAPTRSVFLYQTEIHEREKKSLLSQSRSYALSGNVNRFTYCAQPNFTLGNESWESRKKKPTTNQCTQSQ